jgi:hypothetical protein
VAGIYYVKPKKNLTIKNLKQGKLTAQRKNTLVSINYRYVKVLIGFGG